MNIRTFSFASIHAELHIFLYSQKEIDSVKDEINKWEFIEIEYVRLSRVSLEYTNQYSYSSLDATMQFQSI